MTERIESACSAIVTILSGISAFQHVPIDPPDTISVSTFAIVYPKDGTIDNGVVGGKKSLHNISIDALTKRGDQAQDLARMKPFLDTVPAALLADPTLTNTVQTFASISYELITPNYSGIEMIGYQFTINDVKILV